MQDGEHMKLPFLTKEPIIDLTLDELEIGSIVYNEGVYHTFALTNDRRKIVEFVSVELKNFTFNSVVASAFCELSLPTAIVRANKIYLFFNQKGSVKLTVCGKDGKWVEHPEPVLKRVGRVDVKLTRIDGEYHLLTLDKKGEIKDYTSQNTLQWALDANLISNVKINGAKSVNLVSAYGNKYLIYGKGNCTKYALIENGKLMRSVALDDIALPRTAFLLDGRTLLIGRKNDKSVIKEVSVDEQISLRTLREYDTEKEFNWMLDGLFVNEKGYLPDFKANKEYQLYVTFGSATEFYLKLYSHYSQEVYVYVSKDNGVVVCDATSVNGDGYTSRFTNIEDSVSMTYYREGDILYVFVMGKAFTIALPDVVKGDTLIKSNGTLNCAMRVNDITRR